MQRLSEVLDQRLLVSAAPAPIFLETILIMEDSWSQRDDKMENFRKTKNSSKSRNKIDLLESLFLLRFCLLIFCKIGR